jgi:protein tyrosine phosphatase (PTP) superfamily phosphohydrolase (DUF442 family)
MKRTIILLLSWLFWGFALGTFILLFPLRKTVDMARNYGWSDVIENLLVFIYIIILAVVSYLLARTTTSKIMHGDTSKGAKAAYAGLPIFLAAIALYVMMNPALHNYENTSTKLNTNFTIGSYPTKEKIKELKKEHYTAIISLLHPAVIPFEPKLLNDEISYAKEEGIDVISIPMMPWISKNEAAIDTLRKIVRNAKGKYYIHCYLGKDRVNVARRIIQQETNEKIIYEAGLKHRSIDDIQAFERGSIYKLATGVYFTPFPTEEEYFGYIIATDFQQIVALSNLADPAAAARIDAEGKSLTSYNIAYTVYDVNDEVTEIRIKGIVDSVKAMKTPILIHTFHSDQPAAQLFMKMYGKQP